MKYYIAFLLLGLVLIAGCTTRVTNQETQQSESGQEQSINDSTVESSLSEIDDLFVNETEDDVELGSLI